MGKIKSNHIELGLVIVVLLLVIGIKAIDFGTHENRIDESTQSEVAVPITVDTAETRIKVYITGAVYMPGVYELPEDSRVEDVVKMAGGLTSDADTYAINLAQKVYDTQQISVYKEGEVPEIEIQRPLGAWTLEELNESDADRLTEIDGIGDAMAERIISYRSENGPFNSVDELLNVQGIGEKKIEAIRQVFTKALRE